METLLSLGGEGGSVTIKGEQDSDGQWVFYKEHNETVLADILGEEDADLLALLQQESQMNCTDFMEVLQSLGRDWIHLHPRTVHPEFAWTVFTAVKNGSRPISKELLERWKKACVANHPLYQAAQWLVNSRYTVILSGAGMSTDSGIPDFRSRDGWWKRIDPRLIATVDALEDDYELFQQFYAYRIETLKQYSPHEGYHVLARWEREGLLKATVTQNVDGFHTAAGQTNVMELHGDIRSVRCHQCRREANMIDFLNKNACEACGGVLRPNVVLFGESLPESAWEQSLEEFRKAELVLVIGTSLQVSPASMLPRLTSGKTVYLNMDTEGSDGKFDITVRGKAKKLLLELNEMVQYIARESD